MYAKVAATDIDPALLTALIPIVVIALALDIFALVDLVRRPAVRGGNKWVWAAIILFISAPVGTILYFVIGRSPDKPDIDFGSPLPYTPPQWLGEAQPAAPQSAPATSLPDSIICEGLTKRYGNGFLALDNLNLRVPAHSVFGFLGPNGAGKTTTISLLTGLIAPTSGKATVAGSDITAQSVQLRARIGYLAQEPNFYPWMTGYEFLVFVGEIFGLPPAERSQRANELLALVGLSNAANRRVGTYSGGMKQRLGIAQSLVNHPDIIFLDEPVSALDPIGRREILLLLDRLRSETTAFFSSHILEDVDRVCDRVAILNKGKIVAADSVEHLKEEYARPLFRVEVDSPDAALHLADSVRGYGWARSSEASGPNVTVEAADLAVARTALPRLIVESGVTLLRYDVALPSLEDVFVRLVGADTAAAITQPVAGRQ